MNQNLYFELIRCLFFHYFLDFTIKFTERKSWKNDNLQIDNLWIIKNKSSFSSWKTVNVKFWSTLLLNSCVQDQMNLDLEYDSFSQIPIIALCFPGWNFRPRDLFVMQKI